MLIKNMTFGYVRRKVDMSDVKIYRITGEIRSPHYQTKFSKDMRALRPEDVIEKVYVDIGSQHRVKRIHIKITSITEISVEETEDPVIRALSEG
jgi:large subunit ribosomal protein LX